MADTYVPIQAPVNVDQKLDAEGPIVVSGNNVVRERVQLAGAAAAEVVAVTNTTPSTSAYGVVTRGVSTIVDNAAFTDGTTPLTGVGYIFDDIAGTALTENDVAAARIDAKRALMVTLEDSATRGQKARILLANAAISDGGIVTRPVGTLVDNAGFTDGTSNVFPVGYILDETAGTALTENDVATPRIDSKRASVLVIEDTTTRGQRASVSATNALKVDIEELPASAALSDTLANPTTTLIGAATLQYNGTTWERVQGPSNVTILASAARTTTQTQADQTNISARGIIVVVDVTVVGTGSITLDIQGKDAVSGKYISLLTSAAIITNSTNTYTVFPAATVAANVSANMQLWRTWRTVVTANNANTITYSVGAVLLP